MGIATIFAKAPETATAGEMTSRFPMEFPKSTRSWARKSAQPGDLSECSQRETKSGHHNHHRKSDRHSFCGRRDSATRSGSPIDQHVHGHGSPAGSCGPRYKLESFQSVANESAVVSITTTFAKGNRGCNGRRNDPRLEMGSRVFSRVLNVMAMWSNPSVLKTPSSLREKRM